MLSWQVDRVRNTRIVEMDLPVSATVIPQATTAQLRKSAWLYPHLVGEDDTLKLSIHALLVEAPGLKLVVDTCVGNDRPREITGGQPLATPFLQHLGEAGWSREGVDAVVCTHLHVDHVGWNTMLENGKWAPTFPKARYLMPNGPTRGSSSSAPTSPPPPPATSCATAQRSGLRCEGGGFWRPDHRSRFADALTRNPPAWKIATIRHRPGVPSNCGSVL
jgi:hypothetical protein